MPSTYPHRINNPCRYIFGIEIMTKRENILESALQLKAHERFFIIEGLLQSLDEPNHQLDEIWRVEAEKRLNAYRKGQLKTIHKEDIFDDED